MLRPIGLFVIAGLLAVSVQSAAAQTTMLAEVDRLAWNADGTVLGMSGYGASGSEFQFWEVPPDVETVRFGPAPIPVSAPTHIRTIETEDLPSLAWHPTEPGTVAITSSNGDVQVLDVFTGESLSSMQAYGDVRDVDWSPDGTRLALATGTPGGGAGGQGGVEIWDREGGLISNIWAGGTWASDIAWSPDGTQIAVGTTSNDIIHVVVLDVASESSVTALSGEIYQDEMSGLYRNYGFWLGTWSPTGDRLLVTETVGDMYIYRSEDFELDTFAFLPIVGWTDSVSWNERTDMIAMSSSSEIMLFHVDYPDYAATYRSDPIRKPSEADWNPVTGQLAFYLDSTLHVLTPPTADAGPDQTVQADSSGYANVTLDGNGSTDSDGYIVSYSWHVDDYTPVTGPAPTLSLPEGEHTIVLVVTDIDGMIAVDTVTITVEIPPASA